MTLLHSIILGLVEGVTEFLPVSSTAHLEVASRLLGLIQTDFVKSFIIIIQLGAILAVVVLYAARLRKNRIIWLKVLAAFIPTGIIGFILYKFIKHYLLGNFEVIVWSLFIGGVIIILFEMLHRDTVSDEDTIQELERMPYSHAVIIGTAQALAVIPGVSRSAATILSGLSLGISRKAIVEFSFLLAIPTMVAATGLDLVKNASGFSAGQEGSLAVGFIVAFLSALISVKFFLSFIQKHNFTWFGVYRVVLALILFGKLFS